MADPEPTTRSLTRNMTAMTRMRDVVGEPALNWLLGDTDVDTLNAEQQGVFEFLLAVACPPGQPERVAGRTAGLRLSHYDENAGCALGSWFRSYFGGSPPAAVEPTGDPLKDAVTRLAVDCYTSLLIPHDNLPRLTVTYNHPAHRDFCDAARLDPILKVLSPNEDDMSGVGVARSTAMSSGVQLAQVSGDLVNAAWRLARLPTGEASLDDLLNSVPTAVDMLRAALDKDSDGWCIGLAGLTGALLPEGREIAGTWGRLRPCRPDERLSHLERRTERHLDNGEVIAINDAGDIVLEARVPYNAEVHDGEFSEFRARHMKTSSLVGELVLLVRLAFVLAYEPFPPPTLIAVWRRYIEPLAESGYSYANPDLAASRTPTVLTDEHVDRWQWWIEALRQIDMQALGPIVPKRLLRAVAERQDPMDTLIDCVIVLESLFGAKTEATLRVSGAVACLCFPPGESRDQAQKEVKSLYNTRSSIVHGGKEPQPEKVYEASQQCLRFAIESIKRLVTDRQDLLTLESSDRGLRLLLG